MRQQQTVSQGFHFIPPFRLRLCSLYCAFPPALFRDWIELYWFLEYALGFARKGRRIGGQGTGAVAQMLSTVGKPTAATWSSEISGGNQQFSKTLHTLR